MTEARELPKNYRPANSKNVPEGSACGNCIFYRENKQNEKNLSYCERWDDYVRGDYYCNAWKSNEASLDKIETENEGRVKGNKVLKKEERTTQAGFEIREEAEGMHFSGYAALFDSPSEPLPFTETIAKGAFKRSLRSRNDIKFLWNHDAGEILGSTRAKTLTVYEDDKGLRVEGVLPNTNRGRDVAELLRRNDVDSMSFGFSVPQGGDSWSEDGSQRTLKAVRIHEVSLVAWPAYTATAGTVAVRKYEKTAERSSVDVTDLADALTKLEDGQDITIEEQKLLERVITSLAPETEVEIAPVEDLTNEYDLSMLALKKKKLELLMKGIV